MEDRLIKTGTKIYFGAPSTPMPKELSDAIAELVQTTTGIQEAHLPQCFIEGDESGPQQVLVVSIESASNFDRVMSILGKGLNKILPEGVFLDVLPYPESEFPEYVRTAGCMIFKAQKKFWWKFW